ncbi:C2H2 finger domain containing protein FlbC [Apiospora arundinis]
MYTQGLHGLGGLDSLSKQHAARSHPNTSSSMASYGSIPVTASSAGSTLMADVYGQQDLLNMPQDLLNLNRMQTTSAAYGEPSYATATSASPVHATYAASPSPYDGGMPGYAPAPIRSTFALAPESDSRRYSQSSVPSITSDLGHDDACRSHRNSLVDFDHRGMQQDDRRSFADALDAGQGMLAMSQETPRAIYPPEQPGPRIHRFIWLPLHTFHQLFDIVGEQLQQQQLLRWIYRLIGERLLDCWFRYRVGNIADVTST